MTDIPIRFEAFQAVSFTLTLSLFLYMLSSFIHWLTDVFKTKKISIFARTGGRPL